MYIDPKPIMIYHFIILKSIKDKLTTLLRNHLQPSDKEDGHMQMCMGTIKYQK